MSENQANGSQGAENPSTEPQGAKAPSFVAPHLDRIASTAAEIKNQVASQGVQAVSQVAEKVAGSIEQAKQFVAGQAQPKEADTNFVTMETEADRIKRKNLYYVSAFIGFVWMLFHFTVVFFFGIELGSAALVGIFLGFGNLVALALDIPVGILQKYFYAKRLYLFSGAAMLVASTIFLKFIYASSLFKPDSG